jgi:hypothetical protein
MPRIVRIATSSLATLEDVRSRTISATPTRSAPGQ